MGRKLTELLLEKGHQVVILTRSDRPSNPKIKYVKWLQEGAAPEKEIEKADAIINLAGVSINEGRWTEKHQKQIYESRMTATDEILRIVESLPEKPSVLVNASAIGIYPPSLHAVYTESSTEISNDFLGRTVHDWEKKAIQTAVHGVRVVSMRFGVVLGKEGGALPLMVLPYKLFIGGRLGSGEQWVSWVHVTDVARALLFAVENNHLKGPVNVTSPFPTRMEEFGKTIAAVLRRPHWLPVPAILMKLALGKKSSLVLEGQQVLPKVLLKEGFEFSFSSLEAALTELLT
ncbi:MAG: TIGR01777 family oxidoreductase [Bacteroidota bacterium]|nr:TIGR01777 family oxidoreductase [Bacteroidota bacterium]